MRLAAAGLLALVACSGERRPAPPAPPGPPPPAVMVDLQPDSLTLFPGQQYRMRAVTSRPTLLRWTSSDTTVATVDSLGIVTTRRPGTVDITAAVP